jgi:hypothetical protein
MTEQLLQCCRTVSLKITFLSRFAVSVPDCHDNKTASITWKLERKVKLSHCLIKTYGGAEVNLQPFFTSPLHSGQCHAPAVIPPAVHLILGRISTWDTLDAVEERKNILIWKPNPDLWVIKLLPSSLYQLSYTDTCCCWSTFTRKIYGIINLKKSSKVKLFL